MTTREEALAYGLSFDNVYEEKPFHDPNWQLVRVRGSKKAFLWIYERNGFINLNVKVAPEWRDFWRSAYDSVIAGYHQNKEHWNTIILDGTIPEKEIRRMIAESYDGKSCGKCPAQESGSGTHSLFPCRHRQRRTRRSIRFWR